MSPSRSRAKSAALHLRLFVAGDAPNSRSAIQNLRATLAAYPSLDAEVEIIDVLEHPEVGVRENVVVTPTMIKVVPLPARRIIGSLKDTRALLGVLGLEEPSR